MLTSEVVTSSTTKPMLLLKLTFSTSISPNSWKTLLAGEYIEMSSDAGDNDAYLLLADYDVNDKLVMVWHVFPKRARCN